MKTRKDEGFTLIELMVTIAVLSILVMLAYPNYQRYVVETRRSDGQIALTKTAAMLEKHYTQCNSYTANVTTGGIMTCNGLGLPSANSPEGYYSISITDIDTSDGATNTIASNYQIVAAPVSGSTQANDGKIRLDSTGARWWDKNNNNAWDTSESTWKKY